MTPKTAVRGAEPRNIGKPGGPEVQENAPATECLQSYPRRVRGKDTTGTCRKPPGHTGPHGRKPSAKTEVPEVSADVLGSYEAVPSDEVVAIKSDSAERSESQKIVDGHVKDSHESWVAAGRPKAFNDSPRKRYMMNPDDAAGMVKMLRRAERLHGVRVRVAPVKTHESGKAMLYWVAVDIKENEKKNTEASATAAAPATSAPDAA